MRERLGRHLVSRQGEGSTEPHLLIRAGSRQVHAPGPQGPDSEGDGDLRAGACCVPSGQRDGGLGSRAQVVQEPRSREDGGAETLCMGHRGPCREEELVAWGRQLWTR